MSSIEKPKAPVAEAEFALNASESELLEEFGVLLAAEYTYQGT
ncbi:hypothetical protein AB0J35_45450 [Nonomuraea angiospora]